MSYEPKSLQCENWTKTAQQIQLNMKSSPVYTQNSGQDTNKINLLVWKKKYSDWLKMSTRGFMVIEMIYV